MNTNNNIYTVVYTAVIVIIVSAVLAFASSSLKSRQEANEKAEVVSQILTAGKFGEKSEWSAKGNDAVIALTSGKIDAVVIDNEPAKAFVAANTGLTILDTPYAVEDYAMAINKENTALKDAIDAALKELTDDGTIPAIINKYIPAEG